jgi:hypothetical protein
MGLKYVIYFFFGGIITSAVTYFASNSKGLLAAFVGTLPIITLSTFLLIYFSAGQSAVLSYARGLMIMIVPWIIFMLSVILLAPRTNFFVSIIVGLCLQIVIAFIILAKFGNVHFRL